MEDECAVVDITEEIINVEEDDKAVMDEDAEGTPVEVDVALEVVAVALIDIEDVPCEEESVEAPAKSDEVALEDKELELVDGTD